MTTMTTAGDDAGAANPPPLLRLRHVSKDYVLEKSLLGRPRRTVSAVNDVSVDIGHGETLAVVGESGSGKSTIGRIAVRLVAESRGEVMHEGEAWSADRAADLAFRKRFQIIFQDPRSSLNPRRSILDILLDPMLLHGEATREQGRQAVAALLERVGLAPAERYLDRKPGQFSGGQLQRIAIARALSLRPRLVVADEPVSALDASVRAQVLQLIREQQASAGISFLFITHDLAVARNIAHRVMVMYLGKVVETGKVDDVFSAPAHPYTRALLASTPLPDPERERVRTKVLLKGEIPSAANPPAGCRFHPRCPAAMAVCRSTEPALTEVGAGHVAACHLHREAPAR